jgi:hypothetical protein
VLGLHLTPTEGEPIGEEEWAARRGSLAVLSSMWSESVDLKRRNEHIGMTFDVYTPTRHFRICDETDYRTYTAPQMRSLLKKVPELEVVETYGADALRYTVISQMEELRRDFGVWVRDAYPRWMRGEGDPPILSTDLVEIFLLPLLGDEPVFLVVRGFVVTDVGQILDPLQPLFHFLHVHVLPPWVDCVQIGGDLIGHLAR